MLYVTINGQKATLQDIADYYREHKPATTPNVGPHTDMSRNISGANAQDVSDQFQRFFGWWHRRPEGVDMKNFGGTDMRESMSAMSNLFEDEDTIVMIGYEVALGLWDESKHTAGASMILYTNNFQPDEGQSNTDFVDAFFTTITTLPITIGGGGTATIRLNGIDKSKFPNADKLISTIQSSAVAQKLVIGQETINAGVAGKLIPSLVVTHSIMVKYG